MSQRALNYGLIQSMDQLKLLVEKLLESDSPVGFDVETGYSGLDREKGSLDIAWDQQFVCGFSLSGNKTWARYIPVRHDFGPNLDEDEVWTVVKPLLESAKIVAHHLKFEQRNMNKLGIKVNGYADSMLESYVLAETSRHGLKELVDTHFGHKMSVIQSLFPDATEKQLKCIRFNPLDPLSPEVYNYACEDAAWCLALHEKNGVKARTQHKTLHSLEMLTSDLMAEVEDYGISIDWPAIVEANAQGQDFAVRFERQVKIMLGEMAGRDLLTMNLRSTKQMKELLYNSQDDGGLGLRTSRLTKSKALSTDAIALERLSREHSAVKKLLELREVNNLAGRLEKWLHDYHFGKDGRVHPSFGQVIVPTGRFAAQDPAIQQLPKEWRWGTETTVDLSSKENADEWERLTTTGVNGQDYWYGNFRKFIIASPDHYLLTFDYSQGELRILAGVTQEPSLLKAFEEGQDVHKLTAAMMLGKTIETLDKKDRAIGKTMNFALVYQMGVESLAERLAIPLDRAKELYATYFQQFTKVATWMEKIKAEGHRNGYVMTPFGRKCTVWELQSDNRAIRSKAERVMVNYPIQGGLADYVKIAMVRTVKRLRELGWWRNGCTLIMNQHDSLTLEVSNKLDPAMVRKELKPCIVFPVKGFPTIEADWELGQSWGASTPWKDEEVHFDGANWSVAQAVHEEVPAGDSEAGSSLPAGTDQSDQTDVTPGIKEAKTLLIEMDEMPTVSQFNRLLAVLSANVGANTVHLQTPEGELALDVGTSLTETDQGTFSMILGNVRVHTPTSEVNAEALTAGLEL